MSDAPDNGLLPEGLRDALPPEAAHEEMLTRRLIDQFQAHGYERVAAPLIEFEDSMLSRLDAAARLDMFRLLDADSQRVMVLRSDMTGQVARIAATRLGHWERPLRLCYAGVALRVKGTQLRPERQFRQAGIELIGAPTTASVVEVIKLAHLALIEIGISQVSIDLTVPSLVPLICEALALDPSERDIVGEALDSRDVGRLSGIASAAATVFLALLNAPNDAEGALAAVDKIELPVEAQTHVGRVAAVARALTEQAPELRLTVDWGEHRGFAYQNALGFTLYSAAARGELGRGGCYGIRRPDRTVEPATGVTLYLDSLVQAAPMTPPLPRVLVPADLDFGERGRLQNEGWVTVAAFDFGTAEARRLRCEFIWSDGAPRPLDQVPGEG